jgi:hypothetical protein
MVAGFYGLYTANKSGKFSMSYNVRERHWGDFSSQVDLSIDSFIDYGYP